MRIDHKVRFRALETILEIVFIERNRNGIDHLCWVKFRRIVENYININGDVPQKPKLILFDADRPPFFDRKKFTLNVNRELWAEAEIGEPLACFMLLHEVAHILMHLHPIVSFSRAEHSQINFADDEESAEWQANVFAAFFMAPPYLAIDCTDNQSFLQRFNFPAEFVQFWFEIRNRRPLKFVTEFCPKCGTLPLVRVGRRLRCQNCGHGRSY
jgi:ribosomal protein S27AE